MTALCLWLTAGAIVLSALITWAVAREVMRAGRLAMPDEADMNDGAAVPHGPFMAALHTGDILGGMLHCPRWPACGCPDGAVRDDCPGLRKR